VLYKQQMTLLYAAILQYAVGKLQFWSVSRSVRAVGRSLSLSLSLHFPGEPVLAGVYWSKGWSRWWWQL